MVGGSLGGGAELLGQEAVGQGEDVALQAEKVVGSCRSFDFCCESTKSSFILFLDAAE